MFLKETYVAQKSKSIYWHTCAWSNSFQGASWISRVIFQINTLLLFYAHYYYLRIYIRKENSIQQFISIM